MSFQLLLAEGAHDVAPLLDPHGLGLVFWTAVTFLIVLVALYKNAWGPLMTALDKREAAITGQVADAKRIREEAEAIKAKHDAELQGIRGEAAKIIEEGEADKKRIIADAHERANAEAKEIKDRAVRDVQLAKQKALAEIKGEAVGIAMQIAEKVIGAEVDAKRHHALVDQVLARMEKGAHGGA